MAKIKIMYVCGNCGYESMKWLGKCPECSRFNAFEEREAESKKTLGKTIKTTSVVNLGDVTDKYVEKRIQTDISELDTVLNGGIAEGSITLLGGDPGIGKSTLLLQLCENIGKKGCKVLYVSGEESVNQIKLRANRLKVSSHNINLLAETDFDIIANAIKEVKPDLVFIDSIQTIYNEEISSSAGSVTQIRECTSAFMKISKRENIAIIVVGHVTKDGSIAGPKILEHMVDTVLYFEGDRNLSYRIIRSIKNRFGPANEIGVFEMHDGGLKPIVNPSAYMLSGRPINASGSVITAAVEGTRPILTEVQALISYSNYGMGKRTATGVDYNRVSMLMAVLEKKAGFQLGNYDCYINIAGGLKATEPAIDLAIVAAMTGSYKNIVIDPKTIIFGEVGLTGEIRAVYLSDKRVAEARKLGFNRCIMPQANIKQLKETDGMTIYGVSNISEVLELLF